MRTTAAFLACSMVFALAPAQALAAAPPITDKRESITPAVLEFTGTLFAVSGIALGATSVVFGVRASQAGTAAESAGEATQADLLAQQESDRTTGYILLGAAGGAALIGAIFLVIGQAEVSRGRGPGLLRRARGLRVHTGRGVGLSYTLKF